MTFISAPCIQTQFIRFRAVVRLLQALVDVCSNGLIREFANERQFNYYSSSSKAWNGGKSPKLLRKLEHTFARLCADIETEASFTVLSGWGDYVDALEAALFVSTYLRVHITICLASVALIHIHAVSGQQVLHVSLATHILRLTIRN